VLAVRQWVAEHLWPGRPLPEGLRLEMHPAVRHVLLRGMPAVGPDLDGLFDVPVVVTPLLETGAWRLVTVTEDVHTGGKMP
jgi:hypothetical protein